MEMKRDIRDCVSEFYRLLVNTSDLQISAITKTRICPYSIQCYHKKHASDSTAFSVIIKCTYLLVLIDPPNVITKNTFLSEFYPVLHVS